MMLLHITHVKRALYELRVCSVPQGESPGVQIISSCRCTECL